MNANEQAVENFNRNARLYADKYFALTDYNAFYDKLLAGLDRGGSFLDVACGPGNVSAYLHKARPDLDILGVDLAPHMLEEARRRVPGVRFEACDCRQLQSLDRRFDGAASAFVLSYLDDADARSALASLHAVLNDGAPLLLSTITGQEEAERLVRSSSGDEILMFYRTPDQVRRMVEASGFRLTSSELVSSPANSSLRTEDLLLLAIR